MNKIFYCKDCNATIIKHELGRNPHRCKVCRKKRIAAQLRGYQVIIRQRRALAKAARKVRL